MSSVVVAPLVKEAKRLVPTENHFLVCGDAKFGSLRGSESPVFGRILCKVDELFPERRLPDVPENRTSMLDSVHHWCVRQHVLLRCHACA